MIYYWEKNQKYIKSQLVTLISKVKTIKPNKTKGYNYLVLGSGFDTETTTIETDDLITAYCYHWQMSFNNMTVGGRSLKSMKDFFKYLLSILNEKNRLLVLDAYLGFEYSFCKHYWSDLTIEEMFSKDKRNPLKFCLAGKIEFREVIGLFGRSLESIAQSLTKTKKLKGDLDYSLWRFSNTPLTYEEKKYCENDVQILSELAMYLFNNYFGENMDLPLTAISEIREMIKLKIGSNLKEIKAQIQYDLPNEETYYIHRNFLFKGGLCGTNSIYMDRTIHNVGHADITSHYPSCMNHFKYPMGRVREVSPVYFMSENKPYIAIVEFINLRSRTSHSILSTHKALDFDVKSAVVSAQLQKHFKKQSDRYIVDNGRIFYADRITYVVNDIEMNSINQAYKCDSFIVHRCWEFERYGKLPYYVLEVLNGEYLKKQDLKARGLDETTEYIFSKNRVNGTFGMMCTALYCDKFITDEFGNIEPAMTENGEVYKKEYKDAIKSLFLNPYWGMWVTAYARSILIDVITKFPHVIIQYDTDSVFFKTGTVESTQLVDYLNQYNADMEAHNNILFKSNEHFKTLGCWDIDPPYTHFKGLGSKRYMFRYFDKKENKFLIKSVVAGCRKGTILKQFLFDKHYDEVASTQQIEELFDYFQDGLLIDKEHSEKMTTHYIDYEKPVKLKVEDYQGNEEEIELWSGTALVPATFHLGLSDAHTRFYLTMQGLYNNAPKGLSKIYEDILTDVEIYEIMN